MDLAELTNLKQSSDLMRLWRRGKEQADLVRSRPGERNPDSHLTMSGRRGYQGCDTSQPIWSEVDQVKETLTPA